MKTQITYKIRHKIKRLRRWFIALWVRLMDWFGYEKEELLAAVQGSDWKSLVNEFDQYLRSECKYKDNEAACDIREHLWEMIKDNNLTLE